MKSRALFKRSYILFVLLASCFALAGCSGSTSITGQTHYIELIRMDAQSQSAQSQIVVTDGYLSDRWPTSNSFSLKGINDQYFAMGLSYDVVLVNTDDFKPVKEILNEPPVSNNKLIGPWYRVRKTYTKISYHGLTSNNLLQQSTLQALEFKDPLNPSYQSIFSVSAQRTDSARYDTHELMTIQPYRDHLLVSAKSTIYDLVADSLDTRLYTNPYYETVSFYTGTSDNNFSLTSDFRPDLPYNYIDYEHYQGLLGDHYAFLTDHSPSLYVQDFSKNVTRKVHDNVFENAYAVAGDQLIFATSDKIFRYDPSTDQTEVLYVPDAPFYVYDLSMHFDAASNQLFVSFAQDVVNNYANDGYWVRCIRIDLADKSVTDLYSERCKDRVFPLITNFIQINGQYYTTTSFQFP